MARDTLRGIFTLGAVLTSTACGAGTPDPPVQAEGESAPVTAGAFGGRSYERSFVFATTNADSIFLVPWILEAVETPDSVQRTASGWLARGGLWERFYADRWATAQSRSPAQVLPHGSLSFVVREGDAIDGVIFEEGPRSLELVLGDVSATWVGSRGETVEVLSGALYLSDQRVEGTVLDMARPSVEGATPGGDWAFLLSGDSARFVFAADAEHGGESEPIYRGWGDLEDSALQWPEVFAEWRRTQAFPPARRDVPVAWRLWSPDGAMEGQLEAVSSDIRPGEGPGPLLPVRALFEVVGELSTDQGDFEVHGLLVHERR